MTVGSKFTNTYSYSLGARCGVECIGMAIAMFLSNSLVANMLLAKTKGNGLGWGFNALGWGLAFGFPTMMFGYISAFFNPAAVLFQWVVGNVSGTEFLALSAAELAGAFIGAVLAWLVYLPHFNVVPEPPAVESLDPYRVDTLLNAGVGRHFSPTELNFASYNNNAVDQFMRQHPAKALESTVRDIGDLLKLAKTQIQVRRRELEERLRRQSTEVQRIEVEGRLRDLEERLRTLDEHEMKAQMAEQAITCTLSEAGVVRSDAIQRNSQADTEMGVVVSPPTKVSSREQARYEAELIADQNIKLGIFSTRPAIYMPIHNLVCEFICTVVLLICANMASARGNQLYEPARGLFGSLFGIWLSFLIFLMILVIGGPTGLAVNPARDLGPRIAHFVLPIPGKGPSEFISYGWIPIVAPFAGGAAAGGLYLLLQKMNFSDVPAGSIVCAEAL